MAYLKEHTCDECGKPAAYELKNRQNETWGRYCKRCGERRLKWLQEQEADRG